MRGRLPALILCVLCVGLPALAATGEPDWITVDYARLVDRRALSHSGESVGALLARLGGRALPPAGERPSDRIAQDLLEPLVESYAFVLSDALDSLDASRHERPLV